MTREECDVGEQDVGERKEMLGKKKSVESYLSHI